MALKINKVYRARYKNQDFKQNTFDSKYVISEIYQNDAHSVPIAMKKENCEKSKPPFVLNLVQNRSNELKQPKIALAKFNKINRT